MRCACLWALLLAACDEPVERRGSDLGPVDKGVSDLHEAPDQATGDGGVGDAAVGDGGAPRPDGSPFGIATSAASSWNLQGWVPQIAATGISWVRGFQSSQADVRLTYLESHKMKVSGILIYSATSPQTFPVDDISGWTQHITNLVGLCKGRVHHWEVWNEPPNFSANKSPQDYATIVKEAHKAVKAVDPNIKVGLAAQSVNLNFLDQALVAGAASHFDFVTVHPYETLGLVKRGWEAAFMAIVPTIRKMLAARSPAQKDVPIWFTELGEPVEGSTTEADQATTVIKSYTMGIAQGAERIHWFEGREGDSGPFGLIDASGKKRVSYTAMTQLIKHLSTRPAYEGWLLLEQAHYAFVFTGDAGPVMVAWARPNKTQTISFGQTVTLIDPNTGSSQQAGTHNLTNDPVIVTGVPAAMVQSARANRSRPFPWGGDYTGATDVSYTAPDQEAGLHPTTDTVVRSFGGDTARDCSTRASQSFGVDRNFLAYDSAPISITVVLRRNGTESAGFNLKYESVSGWKSTGAWYTVPAGSQWHTQSWTINDAQFVGKWGYNFALDSDSTDNSKYSIQTVTVSKL